MNITKNKIKRITLKRWVKELLKIMLLVMLYTIYINLHNTNTNILNIILLGIIYISGIILIEAWGFNYE